MNFKEWMIHEGTMELETTIISRALLKAISKVKDKINPDAWHQFTWGEDNLISKATKNYNSLYISGWNTLDIQNDMVGDIWSTDNIPNLVFYVKEGEPNQDGAYNFGLKTLMAFIKNPRNESGKLDINKANSMIKMVIRHELEHYKQRNPSSPPSWLSSHGGPPSNVSFDNSDSVWKYLSHPAEIEAWVSGMYKSAKSNKIPFETIAEIQKNKFINNMKNAGISGVEATSVMDKVWDLWMHYKSNRFLGKRYAAV